MVMCEYLEDYQEDLDAVTGNTNVMEMAHCLNIEKAFGYLREWMDTLGMMPMTRSVRFEEGTRNTVMLIIID